MSAECSGCGEHHAPESGALCHNCEAAIHAVAHVKTNLDVTRLIKSEGNLKRENAKLLLELNTIRVAMHHITQVLVTTKRKVEEMDMTQKPQFYECGICDHWHSVSWDGDCREDAARFTVQALEDKHGWDGWEEAPMPGGEEDVP